MKRASGESALSTLAETHRHPDAGERGSQAKKAALPTQAARRCSPCSPPTMACATRSRSAPLRSLAAPVRRGRPVSQRRVKRASCAASAESSSSSARPTFSGKFGQWTLTEVRGCVAGRTPRCGVYGLCCKREGLETTCKQAWTRFASPPPSLGCSRPALTLTRPCPAPIYGNA